MPRFGRIVLSGRPHHITQRGNNKQDIFFTLEDRQSYLNILSEQSKEYKLKIHGYCLMSNHVHIIATPEEDDSLAKAVGRAHYIYAQLINRLHGRTGHLWHSRFFSCVLDEMHYLEAMRYVENNPVRARMCRRAWDYVWSSARDHLGQRKESGIIDIAEWKKDISQERWKTLLNEKINEEEMKNLIIHTRTGRPLGSDTFISKVEAKIGRRLRPFPIGRPKKILLK